MLTPVLEETGFASAVIDALSSNICVVNRVGGIIAVNRAWQDFTIANPPVSSGAGIGINYLEVCQRASGMDTEEAAKFASGLRSVLERSIERFEMEYPCHSPTQNRWFLGRVTPLKTKQGGAVISHANITDRKLLEVELAKIAATDALTGLPNRRYFLEAANLEVERVRRFGTAASVIMIDLDHFKSVNDTYGHAVGDEALRCLAEVCRNSVRQIDVLARIGGEEFAAILPGTDEAGAHSVAEKLRNAVYETPINAGRNLINISASFGVAEVRSFDMGIEDCLSRADLALYAAKRAGRNSAMSFTAIPADSKRRSGMYPKS
jgi:diguanylate cyclase (GGDEF)-like protein